MRTVSSNSRAGVRLYQKAIGVALAAGTTLVFGACAPGFNGVATPIAQSIDASIGCKNFEDAFWTSMGATIESTGQPPFAMDVDQAMKQQMKSSVRLGKLSSSSKAKLTNLVTDLATTIGSRNEKGLSTEANELLDPDLSRGLWLERIAQLEIGDRTTPEKSNDVDNVRSKLDQLKSLAETEGLVDVMCATVAPPPSTPTPAPVVASTMFETWKAAYAPSVYGGMKTVATIYQSCDAGGRGPIGAETPDVQGISVVGQHPSGTGNRRQITSLKAFLQTHPYVGNGVYKRPLPTCHDVQGSPPIYDYGGKPHTSTANEKVMNFFKNAGTGSKDLGIDCSGLVFSAYVTAGLKLKKESTLKASLVNGVSSSMLAQPQKNGLTCLDHASFTAKANLKAGDIIAIVGHVLMVAEVGKDPLGIDSLTSASQCKAANISISKFNFSVFQSDPSKGGLGVNRMRASYYLTSSSTMGRGMIDHAVNACKAKFQSAAIISKSSQASVVRHLGTAACIDPVPVQLAKEECLSSCPARSLE